VNNPTYLLALLEQNFSRPRLNNSAAARAETARMLKRTSRAMARVDRQLRAAGVVFAAR
jgi:hypothetical protein